MLTFYGLRGKVDEISSRAEEAGKEKLKRLLEELASRGVAPMPERVCPGPGFTHVARFFTASLVQDIASSLGLGAAVIPVEADIPRIADDVLLSVRRGDADPRVAVVAFTELMLPDLDALAAAIQGAGGGEDVLGRARYVWAQLVVNAPAPFDYYYDPSDYEREIAEKWGARLYAAWHLTLHMEEVMDEVLGEGKPSFPDRLFELAGAQPGDREMSLVRATVMRKLPPEPFVPHLMELIDAVLDAEKKVAARGRER